MRLLVVVVALCFCGGQTASLPSASPAVVRIPSPGINLSSGQSTQTGYASSLPVKSAGAFLPAFKSAFASHPAVTPEKDAALPSAAMGIPAPAMQFSSVGFAYPSVKSATAHTVAESEKGYMSPAVMKIPTPGINLSPSPAFQSVQTPEIVVKSADLQIQKTSEELDATFDTSLEEDDDIEMVSLKADMEMLDDDEDSSAEYEGEMKEEVVMKASMYDGLGAPFMPTPATPMVTAPAAPMIAAPAPLHFNAAAPALAPASVFVAHTPEPVMPSVSMPHVGGWLYAQDEAGQYNFGPWGGSNIRMENMDFLGRTSGSFAYVNPIGNAQIRNYGAVPVSNFHVATSNLPLVTNVVVQDTPKVAMIRSANALLHANIAKILANPYADIESMDMFLD